MSIKKNNKLSKNDDSMQDKCDERKRLKRGNICLVTFGHWIELFALNAIESEPTLHINYIVGAG